MWENNRTGKHNQNNYRVRHVLALRSRKPVCGCKVRDAVAVLACGGRGESIWFRSGAAERLRWQVCSYRCRGMYCLSSRALRIVHAMRLKRLD